MDMKRIIHSAAIGAAAFVLAFLFSFPQTIQAASLHTSFYAHTIKTAVYHYSRSGKSKVRGHIVNHKALRVNSYYKGWYKVIWGKRYVWIYKKYIRKGKNSASLKYQYDAHTIQQAPYQSSNSETSQILGYIDQNTDLLIFKYSGGWYTIKWENKYVYVNDKYVIKGEYIAPKLNGSVIHGEDYDTIILPDGGKFQEYPDGSFFTPDPSDGGSQESKALQVAQAQAIQLGTGNIINNQDGSYTVIVPKTLIEEEAKNQGGKMITYSDGSYAISYPNIKQDDGSLSYPDLTVRIDVPKEGGNYYIASVSVVWPKGF
jgi:hypothetical protein